MAAEVDWKCFGERDGVGLGSELGPESNLSPQLNNTVPYLNRGQVLNAAF